MSTTNRPTIRLDAPDVEEQTLAALTAAHYFQRKKGIAWWSPENLYAHQMPSTVADKRSFLRTAAKFVDSTGREVRSPPIELLAAVHSRLPEAPSDKVISAAERLAYVLNDRWAPSAQLDSSLVRELSCLIDRFSEDCVRTLVLKSTSLQQARLIVRALTSTNVDLL